MVFAEYSGFLHYSQLASHELATIGINVTKNKIQIQIKSLSVCCGRLMIHQYGQGTSLFIVCSMRLMA